MGPPHFLIPWSNLRQVIYWVLQCTKSPLTLTSAYNGIATIISLPSTVSEIHLPRAKTVCTTPELLNKELQHLREALVRCKYPRWAINKIQNKFINNNWVGDGNNNTQAGNNTTQANNNSGGNSEDRPPRGRPNIGHIVIPYVQGLGKSTKNMCAKYGIQTHFKGNKTLRQVLVKPKDQDPKEKKSGVIYSYQCGAINCREEYRGNHPAPWGNTTENISRSLTLNMCTACSPVIISAQTNST